MTNAIILRYSGEFRDYGLQIDEMANLIWDNVSIYSDFFVMLEEWIL